MAVRPRREAGMEGNAMPGWWNKGALSFDSIPDRV